MILHISQTEKKLRTEEDTINNYPWALGKSHDSPKQTKQYDLHSLLDDNAYLSKCTATS